MRFGFVGTNGPAAAMVGLAADTERQGWDGFFTWDGISVGGMPTWDPWAVLAAAAVRTERVLLGAMVFAPARRSPWTLAKQVQTVDHLSGGRLVLPVGIGVADDAAFRMLGWSARERAERLDDALAVLQLASDGGPVTYHGTHVTAEGVDLSPGTLQRPRVPVWVVGAWPSVRSMARAARWDGLVVQLLRSEEEVSPEVLRAIVANVAALRGPEALPGYEVVLSGTLPDGASAARDKVAAYAEAGATWWVEANWSPEATVEDQLARVRQGPPR